jgi:nucleotide-binding universal stress UspA family protein
MAAMRDWSGALPRNITERNREIHNVIVPLDGSETAKTALPIARAIAELEQATVHFVFCGSSSPGPLLKVEDLGLNAAEMRGAVLNHTTGEPPNSIKQLSGDLPQSVIVMSTHTGSDTDQNALGSIADGLLSLAPERILFVTPGQGNQEWRIRRIVMAHDGSPSAQAVLAPVADLAHRAGADVLALHIAARSTERPDEPGSILAPRYIDQPQHEWPSWASEFLDRMLAIGAPPAAVTFKLLVAGGQPGSEIAQFAHDHNVDLVVLPWHGHREHQRCGAVDAVIRNSGCPVLLFRTA